jgi:LysM repeat protein
VLQDALQPEPIIVEELEVKAGDTLSGIAKDKGVSLQSVIDANPQIKNPDMIRPGEVVSIPDPRFEGVPKPRGVADSPRLSEGVADPRKIGDAESTDAPVVAEETEVDTGTDPRELGGAEGYGSVGTPPEADTGEGLMSDPRKLGGAEGYGNPVGDLSIFSKPVDNSYTEFMDIEGDTSHLGGADYKEVGITLPMGIVPTSGLKYTHNGTTIDLPKDPSKRWAELSKAGVTLKNFDASNVDMSQVVKDGIKRSDYTTDENFTKAVLSKFEDSVIKEIENEGVDVDKLDDATIEGLISLAWNVQGHKWKDIEPAYKEMVKENPDMTKVQSGMLQVFTSNGIVVRGLAERRAKDYNKVAEGMGQPTIESYTPVKLKNGNAGFEYAMSDGTTVTRDTGKDYATKASQGSFKKHLNNETNL